MDGAYALVATVRTASLVVGHESTDGHLVEKMATNRSTSLKNRGRLATESRGMRMTTDLLAVKRCPNSMRRRLSHPIRRPTSIRIVMSKSVTTGES